jgi:hypothetical protein
LITAADDARRVSDELEPLAERLGNHGAQLMLGRTKLVIGFFAGPDLDALDDRAEEDRRLGQATAPWLTSASWTWLGLGQFLRGNWEDARALFEEGARLEPPAPLTVGAPPSSSSAWPIWEITARRWPSWRASTSPGSESPC